METERIEYVLTTIDRLGIASVKQLHEILKLGSYRNTCKVVAKLSAYLNVVRSRQKIVYLNKEGRALIGSEAEVKRSALFDHMLLANEAYIHYNCPIDWRRECAIEIEQKSANRFGIQIKGLTPAPTKQVIIADAVFSRNGYVHLVEVDNTRAMVDNRKKIAKYSECWQDIREHFRMPPKLCVFTTTESRRKEFARLCEKLNAEIHII